MRHLLPTLALLTLVAGCANVPFGQPVGPTAATVQAVRIGEALFQTPTAADLRELTAGVSNGYYLPHRPDVHGVISTARQVESGNHVFEANFQAPDVLGDGVLAACLAARLMPPVDAAAYVHDRVLPLVRAWAGDAALDTHYTKLPNLGMGATPDFDPTRVHDEASALANAGWPLAYVSPAKREVLYFYGSGLVVNLRWAPRDYTEATVPITKAQAIARHVAAMHDHASRSVEEQTGLDYFLGVPFKDAFPPPTVNRHDDIVPAADFGPEVAWDAIFDYHYAGKPTWLVHASQGSGLGDGWVDAVTGAEIRFQRPVQGFVAGPFVPLPNGSIMPLPVHSGPVYERNFKILATTPCVGQQVTIHLDSFTPGRAHFWLAGDRPAYPISDPEQHPYQVELGGVDVPASGSADFTFTLAAQYGPIQVTPGRGYRVALEQDGWDGSAEGGFAVGCGPSTPPSPAARLSWSPASPCLTDRLTLHAEGLEGDHAVVMLDKGGRPPRFPTPFPFLYLATVPIHNGTLDFSFTPKDGPPASPDPRLGPSAITPGETYHFTVYDQDGTRQIAALDEFLIQDCAGK